MASNQPCLTVITLGVEDIGKAARFYEALGFTRKVKATGNEVAFFDAGGVVLGLYGWDAAASEPGLPATPRPTTYRGVTLAWNRSSPEEVDAALAHAVEAGATLLKAGHKMPWGGYSGFFADPDGHPWEVVHAPMFPIAADGRLQLPD